MSPSVLQLAGSQSTNTMVSRACPTAFGGHLAYSLALRRMVSPSVSQLAKLTKQEHDGRRPLTCLRHARANTGLGVGV